VPHERFRYPATACRVQRSKGAISTRKNYPHRADSTFWLRSGERLSADGSCPCRAARASIGFSVRVYRTSDNCALTWPVGAVALAGTGAGVQVAPTPVNAAMAECQAQAFERL
jgi:hypothetical protein